MTSPVCPFKSFISATETYLQLQSTILTGTVANNQQIVAAVSGKRIRVYSWLIQSQGAGISGVAFLSASGGTLLMNAVAPSNAAVPANDKLPFCLPGYFETITGEGLFCNIGTTASYVFLDYIVYTPG